MLEKTKLLSRLIGNENVNVVVGDYHTAFFNLEKREIHIPKFTDEMNVSVIENLCIHEISHGLYTSRDDWNEYVINKKYDKDILNVLEDIRIEKLILMKYPNVIKIMREGYGELLNRDFFGINKLADISNLPFLDRLNLHTKLRTLLKVKFNATEQHIVKIAKEMMTWEDVINTYHMIKNYEKYEESTTVKADLDLLEGESKRSLDRVKKYITVEAFEESLRALTEKFDENQSEIIRRECKSIVKNYLSRVNGTFDSSPLLDVDKKTVNNLIKNFEMKKAAMIKKHSKIKNTGELNTEKLYRYKYDENIFLSKEVLPKGKNHAVIVLIDFSYSMQNILDNAIRKALILASFCLKQNIPFMLYTFTSPSRLHEFINTNTMKKQKVLSYINILYNFITPNNPSLYRYQKNAIFGLGSTPLVNSYATIVGEIQDTLLTNRKYEKILFVTITDGYGNMLPDRGKIKIGSKERYVKIEKNTVSSMKNLNRYLRDRDVKTMNIHICDDKIKFLKRKDMFAFKVLETNDMGFDKKILFNAKFVNDQSVNKQFVNAFIEEFA